MICRAAVQDGSSASLNIIYGRELGNCSRAERWKGGTCSETCCCKPTWFSLLNNGNKTVCFLVNAGSQRIRNQTYDSTRPTVWDCDSLSEGCTFSTSLPTLISRLHFHVYRHTVLFYVFLTCCLKSPGN